MNGADCELMLQRNATREASRGDMTNSEPALSDIMRYQLCRQRLNYLETLDEAECQLYSALGRKVYTARRGLNSPIQASVNKYSRVMPLFKLLPFRKVCSVWPVDRKTFSLPTYISLSFWSVCASRSPRQLFIPPLVGVVVTERYGLFQKITGRAGK